MFDPNSRYYNLETLFISISEGHPVAYVSRRFLPQSPSASPVTEHTVTQGERLDHITARYLGDSEVFWQLCDANNAMHPDGLVAELGRKIKITLLQG